MVIPSIRVVLVVSGLFVMGCRSKQNPSKWCSVSATTEDDAVNGESKKYSLLFEEDKGILFAKILKCGSDEYYVGDNVGASSEEVVEKYPKINYLKWSGRLTCLNAIQAYPENSFQTLETLMKLCKQEESAKDSIEPAARTISTEL